MNEQLVRKLARETGFSEWHSESQLLADFTELIVRECADQVSRESEALSILEHFGVDE